MEGKRIEGASFADTGYSYTLSLISGKYICYHHSTFSTITTIMQENYGISDRKTGLATHRGESGSITNGSITAH